MADDLATDRRSVSQSQTILDGKSNQQSQLSDPRAKDCSPVPSDLLLIEDRNYRSTNASTSAGGKTKAPQKMAATKTSATASRVASQDDHQSALLNAFTKSFESLQHSIQDGFRGLKDSLYEYEDYEESGEYQYDYEEEEAIPSTSTSRPDVSTRIAGLCASTSDTADVASTLEGAGCDVLKDIHDKIKVKEHTAASVNGLLAGIVDEFMFKECRPDEKLVREKADSVLRPENCESLVPTTVDELIWGLMKPTTQSADKRLRNSQKLVVKAACLMTGVVNQLQDLQHQVDASARSTVVAALKEGVSAIEMASYASYDINVRRREFIKPDIHSDYMSLFSSTVPINAHLFGGDAAKRLDDIEKTNKAAAKARPQAPFRPEYRHGRGGFNQRARFRPRPYRRGGRGFRGSRGGFLGRPSYPRKKN